MTPPDPLTPERVAELKAIAEKATQKAWFWREEHEPLHMRTLAPGILVLDNDFGCGGPWGDEIDKANAAHIATFDPPTVLALLAEVERLTKEPETRDAVQREAWGEEEDEHSEAIHAAHPTVTKDFDTYHVALKMIGTRRSKYALVDMANWLLARAQSAEAERDAALSRVQGLKSILARAGEFIRDEAENRAHAGSEYSDYEREPRELADDIEAALQTQGGGE